MSAAFEGEQTALPLAFEAPRARGEAVLFVHGFGHTGVVWEGVVDALSEGFRPICVDLRGHGRSPWSPAGEYDLADYARDLASLIDDPRLGAVHVVGHSLGGNAATLAAAARREKVRSLTLVDIAPTLRESGAAHVVGAIDEAFRTYDDVSGHRRALGMLHPLADPARLDRLAESALVRRADGRYELALDPGVMGRANDRDPGATGGGDDRVAFEMARQETALWRALESLERPIFVARGASSSILDEETAARVVEVGGLGSRSRCFERAGHAVMLDAEKAFAAALDAFLRAVAGDG